MAFIVTSFCRICTQRPKWSVSREIACCKAVLVALEIVMTHGCMLGGRNPDFPEGGEKFTLFQTAQYGGKLKSCASNTSTSCSVRDSKAQPSVTFETLGENLQDQILHLTCAFDINCTTDLDRS